MLLPYASKVDELRSGKTTPLALYQRHAAAIAAFEEKTKAFAFRREDHAIRVDLETSGVRWAQGAPLSPIDGMVLGIKDVIETYDMPTIQNSPLFKDNWTRRDGASVQALRAAGAVIMGKTTTAEMATTAPAPTRNPHDSIRTPGGSSSGSAAAVGSGMLPAALGTQVVGSILRPASYCGAYGYKPTFGGLNRGGAYDQLSHSCIGVLGASLGDLWAVSQAIVDRVGGDPGHAGVTLSGSLPAQSMPERLVALETEGWERASPDARSAFDEACRRFADAGCLVETRHTSQAIEQLEEDIRGAFALTRRILAWEWRWPLITYAERDRSALSASLLERLKLGESMTLADYRDALARRDVIRARYGDVLATYDGAIALSATGAAPQGMPTGDASMNVAGSLLGVPCIGLPLLKVEDLPLGLQVLGTMDGDAGLFSLAHALEQMWSDIIDRRYSVIQ